MALEELRIKRGIISHELEGAIKVSGESGSVSVKLSEADCREILKVVADSMVRVAGEMASQLQRELIEQVSAPAPVAEITEAAHDA